MKAIETFINSNCKFEPNQILSGIKRDIRHIFNIIVFTMFALLVTPSSHAQFVRFVEGGQQWQGKLQTSINRYVAKNGTEVELVAAVHIADAAYYEALNAYFEQRDAVLYELVTNEPDPDLSQQARSYGGSAIGFVQAAMARYLQLHFQLQEINYGAVNFRHADLNMQELRSIMDAKNENFFTIFLDLAAAQMASEQQARLNGSGAVSSFTVLSLLTALAADNQGQAVKYLVAQELGRSGGLIIDAELESQVTILGDRNAAALGELQQVLRDGSGQRISLFYGAAHMPGIERALLEELEFSMSEQTWLDAWVIP
ncbi:MAG: hypothetical protein CMQ14_00075 [Gammaproteobacteria bacterium]|nr:hypothetical protein [Gammaproteobacteria bacterium]